MMSLEGTGAAGERSSIVLVGMMAAGKTSIGRRLARARDWEFFDSDRQVETITGRTVAEIWRADGEAAFRRLESEVLADALASRNPSVIAAAGGTVVDPTNRRMLVNHSPVVWLRARPETLAARLGSANHRPLLDEDPAATLAALDAVRRPFYDEVADLAIDVDDLSAEQVLACIEAGLDQGFARPRVGGDPGG